MRPPEILTELCMQVRSTHRIHTNINNEDYLQQQKKVRHRYGELETEEKSITLMWLWCVESCANISAILFSVRWFLYHSFLRFRVQFFFSLSLSHHSLWPLCQMCQTRHLQFSMCFLPAARLRINEHFYRRII